MKKIIVFLFVFFALSFSCFADSTTDYKNSFSLIGADELLEIVDENTKDFFSKNDIDISDYSWVNNLTPKNVFSGLWDIFKSGIKTPLKSGLTVAFIIIFSAGFGSFDLKNGAFKSVSIFCAIASALLIVTGIWSIISASVSAIKYISGFMIAFVPIFVLAVSFSGAVLSGSASGGLILLSANAVSYFAGTYVLPIMGGYLSLNLVSSVYPFTSLAKMSESIKKAVIWTLSLVFTVFVGIVGIGTTVNSASDSFSLKTAKFIIGTCVPIAGGALSDSANTIYASMNVLKSSIGIYGVIVIAIAIIPIIVEILIWKCVLSIISSLSIGFFENNISLFLISVNELLSMIIAILLFSGGLYIITLSIVISVTKL